MSYHWAGILLLWLFNFLKVENVMAQAITEFPLQSGQYFILQSATNPATACLFGKTEAYVANYNNLGVFKNVRTLSFLINHRINNDSNSNYHTIGAYLVNDKEGDFIQRNRVFPSYSFHLKLNSTFNLSTGLALGFANLSAESTPTTAGGSDFAPDGNTGVSIYSKNFVLGVSCNQIFNAKLQPIRQEIVLKRHYNLFLQKQFSLSPYVDFVPSIQLRYPSFPLPYDLDISALFRIQEVVYSGVTYKHNNRLVIHLGFNFPVLQKNHLVAFFSYHSASFVHNSALQGIEFNLGYLLK